MSQKREASNAELNATFIDAEAEKKTKGRQVIHQNICKVHQKDKQKTFPVHSSSSDHSEMVCLCLSADDIQTQKFYFSGDFCKKCSGAQIPARHIANDQMNQKYQYKVFPLHSSVSEQTTVVCTCPASDRTKAKDAVLRSSRNKSHSIKQNTEGIDDKKQARYHGVKHEKKIVSDLPRNVQDSDGSSCYCNKKAHIQARIVKARDNNVVPDEDSSTISSEGTKREKRIRIISERVTTKHEKIRKEQVIGFKIY